MEALHNEQVAKNEAICNKLTATEQWRRSVGKVKPVKRVGKPNRLFEVGVARRRV